MDIISLIDKYVEISVRRQLLEETAKNAERDEYYAKVEGDVAFSEGDYALEKGYNESVRNHRARKQNAEKELTQVMQLLEYTHQTYLQAVRSMNQIELKEASIKIAAKAEDIQRKIDELTNRRNWARAKGDDAFKRHVFSEEQEYNTISSNCYLEIQRITPSLHYYKAFVLDLDFRAAKKQNEDFGAPSGPR